LSDVRGFMKYDRQEFHKEPIKKRKKHYKEFYTFLSDKDLQAQGARCMDCGVPFCQSGCPIGNIIPDWNDLVYKGQWKDAIDRLHRTNNFPEFTGRICPAPCENSCVLAINQSAVTIKNIEVAIVEKAYKKGWLKPNPPKKRSGKKVIIVGSGSAGLACADQLNSAGHTVIVYEKNEVLGGLLALGIPDFKLEKNIIERRLDRMRAEGVIFKTRVNVGKDITATELKEKCDALILSGGAEQPRDLPIPGRDLEGVYQAMDFLPQQNRRVRGLKVDQKFDVTAEGKRVIVLGGGDTGSDCVGTSNRQGCISLKQFELLPTPPDERSQANPWPQWAFTMRSSPSHDEGCERDYSIMTKSFSGENGKLKKFNVENASFP